MLRNESCRGPLSVSPSSRIAFPNSMVEALSFACRSITRADCR